MIGINDMAASRRQSGIALIMTLMLVALLAALGAGLATSTSIESIRASRTANDLQHTLAVDSALRRFVRTDPSKLQLTASGDRWFELYVGDCAVRCRVANDAAKLDVAAFADEGQKNLLERKLRDLARRMDLPEVHVDARPVHKNWRKRDRVASFVWFDQLFVAPEIGVTFSDLDTVIANPEQIVWSDVVTLWGDGRVDVRAAPDDVIRVVLADIDRGAAESIIEARRTGDGNLVQPDLPKQVASQIQQRLTTSSNRYALTLETAINADRRTWYVVFDKRGELVGKVHYRGQVRW